MKKITTFLAILMFAAEALVMAQQPDAEYKLLSRKYEMKSDGNMVYNFRKELKLNSQRAFFSVYGESFIVYNPEFQTLKINEAYTLRADGSRVDAPKNAFVEQLPSACADCGYYNAFREMVVVHTDLETGCPSRQDCLCRGRSRNEICGVGESPFGRQFELCREEPFRESGSETSRQPVYLDRHQFAADNSRALRTRSRQAVPCAVSLHNGRPRQYAAHRFLVTHNSRRFRGRPWRR